MVASPNHITLRQRKMAWREMFLSSTCKYAVMVFIVLFGVLYVLQTSSISAKGFAMSDLEQQIQALENENQKVEFEIATHRSMKSIEERLKGGGFVTVDDAQYATLTGNSVAMR